ncbi:TlpA family protein disulfide reductase [Pedobacter montanisoli]|uniref:TlpA family protein disulfide reductase n=1 Tax=Pedobacter montanisoli TaxID=2923277 RepID=A0ABS9ZSU2_9SPHI|nr:TlpA disulfide reductase family protein [Pedobacter montanisoli]MCJ0741388.1 TlpA family protein disulfide reductase [Pedobacter montanisoli]
MSSLKHLLSASLLLISLNGLAQFKAIVEITAANLEGKTLELNIQDNKGFSFIQSQKQTLQKGANTFVFKLSQPSNMASIGLNIAGKTLQQTLVIDSGKNVFNIALVDNKLAIIAFEAKGYAIRKAMADRFVDQMKQYREASGNKEARALPVKEMNDFFMWSLNHLEKNPGNYYSLITLYQISASNRSVAFSTAALATLKKLDPALQATPLGEQILKDNLEIIKSITAAKTGKEVLSFTVNDINGKAFSNKSLAGQIYIIAFSATWCIPCQAQLPKLKHIYDQYKSKGLKVVYFNDDNKTDLWKKHIKEHQLDWINVSELQAPGKSKISKSFGVYAIPSYLIIDKAGKIFYNSDDTDHELLKFEQKIKELFEG